MVNRLGVLALLLLIDGGCTASEEASKTPPESRSLGDLSGPWQLFVDDHLVETKKGLIRTYHPFEKYSGNPVLTGDRPWEEDRVFVYGTLLPAEEGTGYRLWYHASADGYLSLYATSQDGINWDRPNLGLVKRDGIPENNLFFWRSKEDHMPQVIHTPWEPDPQKRYKLINYDYGRTPPDHMTSGFWAAYSPDGLHWTEVEENPVLVDPGDVGNFVWDPHAERYLGYPKTFAPVRGYRRRCVGFTSTTDFEKWPPAELILVPDEIDDRWVTEDGQHTDLYGLSGFAYESTYLGFLWIFRIEDGKNKGRIFAELVSSHDGIHWVRQEGERPPILPLGAAGSWDQAVVVTLNQPMVEGDTIRLYYGGTNDYHTGGGKAAIGLATLRKDGFASLDAGSEMGTVTTRPLIGSGGELHLNTNASRGWVKVEVLDGEGRVIEGYGRDDCDPISADAVNQKVTWGSRSELPEAKGSRRFRFLLANAALYSFMAGERVKLESPHPPVEASFGFDEDEGTRATDGASDDGLQQARFHNEVRVAPDPDPSAAGGSALHFTGDGATLDTFEIVGTSHLGTQFTLAARMRTENQKLARLFSTHRGSGVPVTGELIFDVNPSVGTLSLTLNGQRVQSRPHFFRDGRYHHFAATHDRGEVKLYLDGNEVAAERIRAGTMHLYYDGSSIDLRRPQGSSSEAGIHLAANLRVGEDQGGRFITYRDKVTTGPDNQLQGWVDDILVVRRVLDAEEIAALGSRPDR